MERDLFAMVMIVVSDQDNRVYVIQDVLGHLFAIVG